MAKPNTTDVRFLYFGRTPENSKHNGIVSVAYRAPQPQDKTIEIGIALCSPKDSFIRQRSQSIASGRLTCEKADIALRDEVPVDPGQKPHEAIAQFLDSDAFKANSHCPRWLRKFGLGAPPAKKVPLKLMADAPEPAQLG